MKAPLFCALILLSTSVWGSDLILEDFDGTVEVKTSSTWKVLEVGASVAPDATVRLSGRAFAEFRDHGMRIHLVKDGSYQLQPLVSRAQAAPAPTVADAVAAAAGRLLGTSKAPRPQAQAGVRGAPVGTQDLVWAEDEPNPHLNRAQELAALGRPAAALRELAAVEVPPTSDDYPAVVLLTASQAYLVGDYDLVQAQVEVGQTLNLAADVSDALTQLGGQAVQARLIQP